MMLISLDLVQCEDSPAAFRKLLQRTTQRDAVDHSGQLRIALAKIAVQRRRLRIDRLVQRNGWGGLPPAKLHQHGVYGNPIEPGRKRGISAKRTDGSEHLQESLLRQVLCLSHILGHEQANRVDAVLVLLK